MKFILSILIALTILAPVPAKAQNISSGKTLEVEGLRIDPFLIEVNATPGSVTEQTIKLTNTTNDPLSFVASINDFVPNGKTGQALFLDSDEEAEAQFSLNRWITITKQPQFTIPPHGTTEVDFTITAPSDAEPGTHYGGILFGRPAQAAKDTETAVQQKVGAIILVRLGKSQEEVSLLGLNVSKRIYQETPITFTTALSNDGNVHSKAKGDITIRNIFGKPIAQVPVNPDALIILPETKRDFISEWMPKFAFGYYTADELLFYGNPKLEIHAHTSFWILPAKKIVLGVLILLILCIMIYMGIKRYNRYIINSSR